MEKEGGRSVEDYIISTIAKERPETVEALVQRIEDKFSVSKDEVIRHIISLENRGIIKLEERPLRTAQTLMEYLSSEKSLWYWTTLTLTITATIAAFVIPDRTYPLTYIRHILGLIFVLWLPGYSLIRALFPTELPIKTGKKALDNIERIALSIGMSLALTPIVALLLNYTPWGITLTPITLTLMVLTIVLSTIAVVREHESGNENYTDL